ncbi:MAG: bifunctional diguanylate cyclase/phosphodiesterase [Legionellaceae bacterium]|nr:bifunctional diguanylate cyclase/phosphodiesterase [Legionellaceae bacterium]
MPKKTNMTAHQSSEKKSQSLQTRDSLTGFENFASIREKIQQLIETSPQNPIAILHIGVDNFKIINHLMGCQKGDLILHELSKIISKNTRKGDLLARKGGDEFFVVLHDYTSPMIIKRAKELLAALSQPFVLNEESIIQVTASMGISCAQPHADNVEELLNHADIALSQAKKMGKNNYQFFTEILGKEIHYRYQLQKDLPYALKRKELFICYQPQIDIKSRRIVGVEALLRWQHPTLGLILPSDFIPIAEETGQITTIGEWVLKSACLQAKSWQKPSYPLKISVNVSVKQLMENCSIGMRNRFLKVVESVLQDVALTPELLELEITEGVFMAASDSRAIIKALSELGVSISCDDFGIGYSSFGRIKDLAFNALKIDSSLIQEISKKSVDLIIISSLIHMAQQLNIKTIAEGVETEEQYLILQELGCDMIQGYYFSAPLLPDEMDLLLEQQF